MTDGTSQGLFIVVAIVIFGIFVVMAYILFEDTLSPALATMFTTATEQSTDRLGQNSSIVVEQYKNEFGDNVLRFIADEEYTDMTIRTHNMARMDEVHQFYTTINYEGTVMSFKGNNHVYDGLRVLQPKYLEKNKEYTLSFDIRVDDGFVNILGGHSPISHYADITVDGEKATVHPSRESTDTNDWNKGILFDKYNDGEYHHVVVRFKTDNYGTHYNHNIDIQPNRGNLDYYETTIKNMQFAKGNSELPYVPHVSDMNVIDNEIVVKNNGKHVFEIEVDGKKHKNTVFVR